ncbi:GntR family transcriptional regulator [Kineosporia sp. A_224]|uniref:GntR family transcriptional regulator n=1 Tax=Kineosporia sp. A_224 TaxID=1962180 RepID=UPI001179C7E1|nr:GntR family transcriptional regulator [Kineosporia sp. A_224]
MPNRRSTTLSRADEAYALLRQRITRCELAPGTAVTARELADDLGLGLTPVREALTQLHRERLVVTMPRRGYRVAPVTATGVRDCLEVWAVVRPRIVALAVTRASAEAARRICALMDDGLDTWADTPTVHAGLENRSRAWSLITAEAGNGLLADVYRLLDGGLLRLRAVLPDGTPLPALPAPAWAELFATRDAERATRRAAAEIEAFRAAVRPLLARLEDAGPGVDEPDGAGAGSLTDAAWAALRRRIIDGRLPPGARLTERALSAELGLGITPVREALARLDHERLVLTLPRTGYVVTDTTPQDVLDTVQVWAYLAPTLVGLAVRHATPAEARRIVALMTAPADDPVTLTENRSQGWRLVAQAGRNVVLGDVVGLVDGALSRLFARLLTGPASPVRAAPLDWARLFAERDQERARTDADRYAAALDEVAHWAVDEVARRA